MVQFYISNTTKIAHPISLSGRKGIAKRHETLKYKVEYAYNWRSPIVVPVSKIGDFFLQNHNSCRYFHKTAANIEKFLFP